MNNIKTIAMIAIARSLLCCIVMAGNLGCHHLLAPRPVPAPPPSMPPPPAVASQITLPVSTAAPDLSVINTELCEHSGGSFSGTYIIDLTVPIGVDVKYEYWHSPITVTISNNTVIANTTAYYWIDGLVQPFGVPIPGQCGHSGEIPRLFAVRAASSISWDPDWHLSTTTTLTNLDDQGIKCKVTAFDKDLTGLLKPNLQRLIEAGFRKVDAIVADKTQFRPQAATVWQQIQQPIQLQSSTWLQLNPKAVLIAPITSTNDPAQELQSTLLITAHPVVLIGAQPPPTNAPLPSLDSQLVPDSSFHLITDTFVTFMEANEILNRPSTGVVNKSFENGDHELLIRKATLGVDGDKLLIVLDVHSDIKTPQYSRPVDAATTIHNGYLFLRSHLRRLVWKTDGTLYARGTPKYTAGQRTVSLPDADYDLATRDFLLKVASWVLHTQVEQQLRAAQLPIGSDLDSTQTHLTHALHHEFNGAILTGNVSHLDLQDIKPSTGALVLRIRADGQANLEVQWH